MVVTLHKSCGQNWLMMLQKSGLAVAGILLAAVVVAQQVGSADRHGELLDTADYRTELEEVIVTAKEPEWRSQQSEQQQWRPEKFGLPKKTSANRMQWLPAYTKDERDSYNGVRDRMGEKADIKLFEWKF